jgi:hypothetical protein
MLDLNSETLIYCTEGMLVICQNNLNEFWDFYHSTNVGACSPKANARMEGVIKQRVRETVLHPHILVKSSTHWIYTASKDPLQIVYW